MCLRLVSDVSRYQSAMDDIVANEPQQYRALNRLAADIANVTPLKVGKFSRNPKP